MPLAGDVDLAALAARTDRFTGADLEDLVRRAGLAALKRSMDSDTVTMEDFEAALKDTRASVTEAMELDYETIQGEFNQQEMSVNPIGFFAPGTIGRAALRDRVTPYVLISVDAVPLTTYYVI